MTHYRASSFVWKVEWSPLYRPSMIIGIVCGLLARENRRMDDEDQLALNETQRERIELAANCKAGRNYNCRGYGGFRFLF